MLLELLNDIWPLFLSFLTLLILEIVLGVDNVIFISLAASELPHELRRRARVIGLSLGLIFRVVFLVSITWVMSLSEPLLSVFGRDLTWRDIILVGGGLFLIYKSVSAISGEFEAPASKATSAAVGLAAVIAQIVVLDIVFSIDSVITAVGVAEHVEIMIMAVAGAMLLMVFASEPISKFIEKHPSTKMLALAFLLLIGVILVADGLHAHVERWPIYLAILFSLLVEVLNLARERKIRKRSGGLRQADQQK